MKRWIAGALVPLLCLASCATSPASTKPAATAEHAEHPTAVSASEALDILGKGNQRYVSGHLQHPHQTPDRRTELANSQVPSAVVIGCSDSRTAPELVFDQGLGDLFVIRVAGNVVDDHALGSVEYAAEHLGTKLIVVLGHERCGAVKAARDSAQAKSEGHDHIASLVAAIKPAVDATAGGDAEATCKANVSNVVKALRSSEPVLRAMVDAGSVKIVGAYYDLDTGAVQFLDM
jgi:carbonic anhydrase